MQSPYEQALDKLKQQAWKHSESAIDAINDGQMALGEKYLNEAGKFDAMGFATGAAVDNQYPVVGKTITQQEQAHVAKDVSSKK